MSPEAVESINRLENAVALLKMRTPELAPFAPKNALGAFDKFTDAQVAAAVAQEAVQLYTLLRGGGDRT